MPELSPRLAMLTDWIGPGDRIADIGTDHAYLPVRLVLNGTAGHAVASDLRPGPLKRAEETVRRYGVDDRVELRLCDGLDGIRPEEADAVIIAGMGGETIAGILGRAPWVRESPVKLILQPMSTQPELRCWLTENGYTIREEKLAREDSMIYVAFLVQPGHDRPMSAAELDAGRQNGDPLRGTWLDARTERARRALEGQRRAGKPDADGIAHTKELIRGLESMKKEWETWQR